METALKLKVGGLCDGKTIEDTRHGSKERLHCKMEQGGEKNQKL